ncbi:hypothetical protein A5N15_03980 [Rothia kristinae]|uniref:Ribonuclease P protein component n=1 Tax=Rothia kristinae TaxID=37923 RepID=A0A657IV22_9MICC|nr:hypothetical protein A5N15_03980 [Rothia kristinae]
MLAQQHRMRTSVQFSAATRSGARSGADVASTPTPAHRRADPRRLHVSKAVGNAVVRNRVKRRLRELAAESIAETPRGLHLVVRALPASAEADWSRLGADYRAALIAARRKLAA